MAIDYTKPLRGIPRGHRHTPAPTRAPLKPRAQGLPAPRLDEPARTRAPQQQTPQTPKGYTRVWTPKGFILQRLSATPSRQQRIIVNRGSGIGGV